MSVDSVRSTCPELIFEARGVNHLIPPRIDCHLHTSWTDGKNSVREVHEAAIRAGLDCILFSEHSRKTSIDWFDQFADEVRRLPAQRCKAYVGTEVKIESRDGDIDISPRIADRCDLVMASVHRLIDPGGKVLEFSETDPDLAVEIEYALTWAALENPRVDILGHMFGMSYSRFSIAPPSTAIRALIARAAAHGVAIEINSYYHPDVGAMLRWCQEAGAQISLGSNAHVIDDVGEIVRLFEGGGIRA